MPLLRILALEHTGLKKLYNGPESFTPDNQFILGEAPECENFFVGAGFTRWGSPQPAVPAAPGGMDRQRRRHDRPDRSGHPPLRPVQRQCALAARPGG